MLIPSSWFIPPYFFLFFTYFICVCFNWSIVDLQYHVSFRCTAQWFSLYIYIYIYIISDSFPLSITTKYWIKFPVLSSRFLWVIGKHSFNHISQMCKPRSREGKPGARGWPAGCLHPQHEIPSGRLQSSCPQQAHTAPPPTETILAPALGQALPWSFLLGCPCS